MQDVETWIDDSFSQTRVCKAHGWALNTLK